MPIELTERQRRLLDTVLILAVIALGFVVLGYRGQRVLHVRRRPAAVLPVLAAVVRAAAADQRGRPARPDASPQAGAVIVVYLAIVVVLLAVLVQASAIARGLDQPVHPGRAPIRGPADATSSRSSRRGSRRSASQVDLVGQAPVIVENLQRWAGELVGPLQSLGGRQHRRVRQHPDPGDPVRLHRGRPRGDPRVPVPARPARPGAEAARCSRSASRGRSAGSCAAQLIMGVTFGLITAVVNVVFGLPYAAVTTVAAGAAPR